MPWAFDRPDFQERKQIIINRILQMPFDESTDFIGGIHAEVRTQLYYILACFESEPRNTTLLQRANKMLQSVFEKFQFHSKMWGYRQWGAFKTYLDDQPSDEYDSNYVNFLSPFFAYIMLNYQDLLIPSVLNLLRQNLPLVASELYAIANHVDYTNMFLLRCAGELMYGQLFNSASLIAQGVSDFQKWIDLVLAYGFPEYNSPNYGFVDWWALSLILSYAPDADFFWMARSVAEWFMADFCLHYHPQFDSIVGSAARALSDAYWWGEQSASSLFYLYWNGSNPNQFTSSASRLLTNSRYYPSAYLGEIALNKTYPLEIQGKYYGIESQTYLTENYAVGTSSGALILSELGSTKSDLSGQNLEIIIHHNGSYPSDIQKVRSTIYWDTSPHYQAFNCIQKEGAGIALLKMQIPESQIAREYSSSVFLGNKKGITEVRINNAIWNGNPVALNSFDVLTAKYNGTYLMIRFTDTRTGSIIDSLANATQNIVLSYANLTNEGIFDELQLKTYYYKGYEKWGPGNTPLYSGYVFEFIDAIESGISFNQFTEAAIEAPIVEYILNDQRNVTYTSLIRPGVKLSIHEQMSSHRILGRSINNQMFDPNWLIKSPYISLPLGISRSQIINWITTGSAYLDGDGDLLPDTWEQTFGFDANVNNSADDFDNDGLTTFAEFQAGTHPKQKSIEQSNKFDYIILVGLYVIIFLGLISLILLLIYPKLQSLVQIHLKTPLVRGKLLVIFFGGVTVSFFLDLLTPLPSILLVYYWIPSFLRTICIIGISSLIELFDTRWTLWIQLIAVFSFGLVFVPIFHIWLYHAVLFVEMIASSLLLGTLIFLTRIIPRDLMKRRQIKGVKIPAMGVLISLGVIYFLMVTRNDFPVIFLQILHLFAGITIFIFVFMHYRSGKNLKK
jgi:hypothetical protein